MSRKKSQPEAPAARAEPAAPERGLGALAPASARLVVAVRMATLRKTPLAELARQALGALPDYAMASAAGIDPVTDFDALLIATANPYDVTETFLIALLKNENRVRARLAAPGGRDPRQLRFPAPGVAVLGRPEHLAAMGAAWYGRLKSFAQRPASEALLTAEVYRLHGALTLGGARLELPRSAQAAVEWPPRLRAHLEYDSPAAAEAAAEVWPRLASQIEATPLVMLLGFGGITRAARVTAVGTTVELDAPVEERHLRALAQVMELLMQQATRRRAR